MGFFYKFDPVKLVEFVKLRIKYECYISFHLYNLLQPNLSLIIFSFRLKTSSPH